MTKQWHGGKGSAPRKNNDQKTYEDNWEKIFGKTSRGGAKPSKDKNKNV